MEGGESRLEHAFMLPMPVKGSLGPVNVSIKYVGNRIVVLAVYPAAEHVVYFVHS